MTQSILQHSAFEVQGSLTLHHVSGPAEVVEGLFSGLEDLLSELVTGGDITETLDGYDLVREGVLVRYLRLRPVAPPF